MKSNQMFHALSILLVSALLLAGCGRKEAPQIVTNPNEIKPEIVNLTHTMDIGLLQLDFSLKGNPEGVGYQIDRAELDPYCNCPGLWRRFNELLPNPANLKEPMKKLISVKVKDREFLFRIRAYDVEGNLGPWSKMIRAKYHDPYAN